MENCKAAKEAMKDCEIDGSKVTVAYTQPKAEPGAKGLSGKPGGQPAGLGKNKSGSRGGNWFIKEMAQ